LEITKSEVEAAGVAAAAVPTDVADAAAQVDAAASRVKREFGPIDIWVNNDMTTIFAPFVEITAEEYRRVTEVTYLGAVHGTMAALRAMLPRDEGIVVRVGSALAIQIDSLTGSLLRRQARNRRIHRLDSKRAASSEEQGPADNGADARSQHAAVQLVSHTSAVSSAAGAADLRAGVCGRSYCVGIDAQAARSLGRHADSHGDRRE
jgi:hypothetical protein